jgi:hypothetical protein
MSDITRCLGSRFLAPQLAAKAEIEATSAETEDAAQSSLDTAPLHPSLPRPYTSSALLPAACSRLSRCVASMRSAEPKVSLTSDFLAHKKKNVNLVVTVVRGW